MNYLNLFLLSICGATAVTAATPGVASLVKVPKWSMFCNDHPDLPLEPTQNLDSCATKCLKSASCKIAVYDSQAKKCAILTDLTNCAFSGRDDTADTNTASFTLIGPHAPRKYQRQDMVSYDTEDIILDDRSQGPISSSYNTISEKDCQGLCDLYTNCGRAQYTTGVNPDDKGQTSCSLYHPGGNKSKYVQQSHHFAKSAGTWMDPKKTQFVVQK